MSYELALDQSGRIVATTIGLWSDETADGFLRDLSKMVATFRRRGKPIAFLGDSRLSPVQTAAVAAKFLDAMTGLVTSPEDRVAVVLASTLAKMQADRVFAATPQARAFTGMAEAEAWTA